jgi:hypothetical protein
MPDYRKGKIYTIRCRTDDTLIYVGSTIQDLCERFAQHRRSCKYEVSKDRLLYSTIGDNIDNWYIELHTLYPCSCVGELKAKEGEIIRLISNLNEKIAGRTQKEWRKDNIEKVVKYKEDEYVRNKEKILKRVKNYRDNNKQKTYETKKKYREDPIRREAILQKKRDDYHNKKLKKNIVL